MYRILLPVDRSERRARRQAEAVLEMPGTDPDRDEPAAELEVDVLHVREGDGSDAAWAAGGFAEEYEDELEAATEGQQVAAVEVAREALESADVECVVHEAAGDPAATIIEAATELDSDLVVLGVSTRSPVGKVLFGSVAQAVILDCDRPVMAVSADDVDDE